LKPATTSQAPEKEDEIDPNELVVIDEGDDQSIASAAPSNGANGAADVVEETVEQLRERLAAAEARADNAERARASTVDSARTSIHQSNKAAIENAITGEEATARELQSQIIAAKEGGDYAKEVELTAKLQKSTYRLERLSEGKNEIDRRIEDEKDQPSDPVEAYVKGMQDRPARWIRAHPDYVTDAAKRNKLERAHAHAVGEDLEPGTDAYFDHVEQRLGLKAAAETTTEERSVSTTRAPAAPVSRSGDPGGSNAQTNANLPSGITLLSDGRYRLSPERRDAARISGLSDAEYLKNVLALQREGALH
jgi:hypothetical protein